MALDFSGGTTAKINAGQASILDDLTPTTQMAWVRLNADPPAQLSGILWKGLFGSGFRFLVIHTASALGFNIDGSTELEVRADLSDFGAYPGANAWFFVVGQAEVGAGNGAQRLFMGSESAFAAEPSVYFKQQDGASPNSNAGHDQLIGNRESDSRQFDGDIAFAAIWNRKLTLGEIIQQQFRPTPTSGCVAMWFPGWQGTGTQRDYTGRGNNGSVTAASIVSGWPKGVVPGWLDLYGQTPYVVAAASVDNDQLAMMGFVASGGGRLPWMW